MRYLTIRECPYNNLDWETTMDYCVCPDKLFKHYNKKHTQRCIGTNCKLFPVFERIYHKVMTDSRDAYLELQSLYHLGGNTITDFILKLAREYYKLHRDRYIDKIVRRFKEHMGIALAVECIEDDECPYFSLAKDITKKKK